MHPGMSASGPHPAHDFAHPAIRVLTVDQTSRWLAAGWRDIRFAPMVSLGYGLLLVLASWALIGGLMAGGMGAMMLPLAGGFLLVGPVFAVGLYDISRSREQGVRPGFRRTLTCWVPHAGQIGIMGVILLMMQFLWTLLSLVIFSLFFHSGPPPLETFLLDILLDPDNMGFLAVGTAVGGVIAAAIFTVSVVSLPMLLDRDVSAVTAISTSIAAVRANWRVLLGWAATIVLITAVGMATFFLGLAIAMPLVGHASWHAYRDLVEPE